MKTWYFIPARKGTKGFKFKNRKLLPITVSQIPDSEKDKIIVSTDDEVLIKFCEDNNVSVRSRPTNISTDESSVKDAILDSIDFFNIDRDDNIVILLPTFPQRTFEDIENTLTFLEDFNLKSCTGKRKITDNHPYLCFEEHDSIFGKKIIDHEFFRRQNYPECFGLCHLVCISKAYEVENLGGLLVNDDTGYMWCDSDLIDVDYKEDFLKYSHEMKMGIERFNPHAFEIEFDPFLRHFERYYESVKLLGKTGKDEMWLDCACGTGYGTQYLSNFTSKMIGFDKDEDAATYGTLFNKNDFTVFTSDLEEIKQLTFDVIFSIETIEHMPMEDASGFLDQCHAILSDTGTLIITTPIVNETNMNPTNEFHFFEASHDDFISLLAKSRFSVIDEMSKMTTFTDGETKLQGYFKCRKYLSM
jgi:CMP-N-acetylneuraminic acid synthetase